MNLLGGLAFLSPAALLLVPPLAGALIYAYLKRGHAKRVVVASLFLLEQLRFQPQSKRSLSLPPRFWFELLLVLILCAILARVALKRSGERIAILLDNSLSMGAHGAQGSRFARAIEEASAYISALPSATQIQLFASSPTLHSLSDSYVSTSQASELLSTLKISSSADILSGAVRELAADHRFDSLTVFTDKRAQSSADGNTAVELHTVSESVPLSNVALTDISLRLETTGQIRLDASASSFAADSVRATLIIMGISQGQFHTLDRRQITIPARETLTTAYVSKDPQVNAFRVELVVAPEQIALNAIHEDDVAYATMQPIASEITLLSDLSPSELGVRSIRSPAINVIRPEQLSQLKLTPRSVLIFHRVAPKSFPQAHALYILPPAESGLFALRPEVRDAEMTWWNPAHSILSYLNVPLLSLTTCTPMSAPSWAEEVMRTNRGTILFSGEQEGFRSAALGFEIFPYGGRGSPFLSILFLNLLQWLSADTLASNFEVVGSTLANSSRGDTIRWYDSEQQGGAIQPSADGFIFERPGIYTVASDKDRERIIAVNFFSREESQTSPVTSVELPQSDTQSELHPNTNLLTERCLWFAILLLLADTTIAGISSVRKIRRGLAT